MDTNRDYYLSFQNCTKLNFYFIELVPIIISFNIRNEQLSQ